MQQSFPSSIHRILISLVLLGVLSAGPALAGCTEQGEASYENCIEMLATAYEGNVPPSLAATCSSLSARTVNACIQQTKPSPQYIVCSRSYTIVIVFHDDPQPNDIRVAFFSPLVCS